MLKKILFLFVAIGSLAGCRPEKLLKTETMPDTLLLFKVEGENEDFRNIGSLFISKDGQEPALVSENVQESAFEYIADVEQVLFIDNAFGLYLYDQGEPVKIAEDVQDFDGEHLSEGKIFYSDLDHELHVYWEGNNQSLSTQSTYYELKGNKVFTVDYQGDFIVFDLETGEVAKIEEDVFTFKIIDGTGHALVINGEGGLFYYDYETGERTHLDDGWIPIDSVKIAGDTVYYIQASSEYNTKLKKMTLGENKIIELAAEVSDYLLGESDVYYLENNGNLIQRSEDDQIKQIASDVSQFEWVNGLVYFQYQEGVVAKWDPEKADVQEIVGDTSLYWQVNADGGVVSLSMTDGLRWNEELVAERLDAFYSYWDGKTVYAEKDALYVLDETGRKKAVMADFSDYTVVYYNNSPVYFNTVGIEDIVGTWYFEGEGQTGYMEITDSFVKTFADDVERKLTVVHDDSYERIDVFVEGESWCLTVLDSSLELDIEGDLYVLTRATKEEAESFYRD